MSEQATQALIERMKTDQELRDRLYAVQDPGERLDLVKAEGFECTAEEIAAFGAALQDADLAEVAAGLWDVCTTNTCSTHCTAHGG